MPKDPPARERIEHVKKQILPKAAKLLGWKNVLDLAWMADTLGETLEAVARFVEAYDTRPDDCYNEWYELKLIVEREGLRPSEDEPEGKDTEEEAD